MTEPGPDPYDADLSAVHNAVDNLGPWLAIWQARREPDAFARRCASDAIAAADELLAATYRIRARLVGETRRADDEAAARVDELLARTRAGPRRLKPAGDRRSKTQTSPEAKESAEGILRPGTDESRAPRDPPRAPRAAGPAGELEPAEAEAAP
jgi:hypothetical protein